jgi:hypothetical protein
MGTLWEAGATMTNADRLGKLDSRYRAGTRTDTEFAAEEAKLLDELLASADLSSPSTREVRSGDLTSDAETPHGQVTWQAPPALAPPQPEEQAASVSPSAYNAPTLVPTSTDTMTTSNADALDDLDEPHWAGILPDTELVAEEAEPDDEIPASADLSSPTAPGLLSGDQTIDADALGKLDEPHRTWTFGDAEITAEAAEQVDEPPASADLSYFTDATTINADKPGKLDARYRPWTLRDTDLAAEKAKPVDELPTSDDLSSPTTPEVLSDDQTSDAETPHGLETREAAPAPARPRPEEQAVRVSPSAYRPPRSAPTVMHATTSNADKPGGLDARYRPRALRDTKLAVAETKLVDEPPASGDLSSTAAPEVRSSDQTSDAETHHGPGPRQAAPVSAPPQPEEQAGTVSPPSYSAPTCVPTFTGATTMLGETKRSQLRLRVPPSVVAILTLVFLLAALGTGFVALRQNTAAGQWRQRDRNAVALNRTLSTRNDELSRDLVSAHAAVVSLNSQTSKLSGQVKSLQIQLSSAASANGKVLARTALLTQLTKQADTVSNELLTCVGEMSSLQTEIGNDLSNPSHKDPLLRSNTHTVSQVCAAVQRDDRQLQSTLRAAR